MIERRPARLHGLGVSEGRGQGPVRLVRLDASSGPRATSAGVAEEEIQRLHHALEAAQKELRSLRGREKEANDLLEAHILLLQDPVLLDQVESRLGALGGKRRRAEEVLEEVIESFAKLFEEKKEPYLRERAADLRDVGRRALGHLTGNRIRLPKDGVIVARDLPPSALLEVKDPKRIDGILLEEGGATSHLVILARAMGIPAVISLEGLLEAVREGVEATFDGGTGEVEILPSGAKALRAIRAPRGKEEGDGPGASLEARTADGVRITLRANIQIPIEVDLAREAGAEGIGLYRTEYLRLEENDERAVSARVSEALAAFPNHPVTIRTADIGGDKFGAGAHLDLGLRGIRHSLADLEAYRREIRAYLTAAKRAGAKNLRLLLPMIATVAEADRVRAILQEEVGGKGVPLGIMVETPAAALTLDLFAGRIDFASLGTNDLAQYTMAAERGNARLADLFETTQPALLRILAEAVARAKEARIPLAVCGEMAGDPAGAVLLVGLGIRELSASPRRLTEVRRALAGATVAEAEKRASALVRAAKRK